MQHVRLLLAFASLAIASLTLAGGAQAQGLDAAAPRLTLLDVSASAQSDHAPDLVTISAGVTTQEPTAQAAIAANARAMTRVFETLKQRGVAARDMQTSGLSLEPRYNYDAQNRGEPPRLVGYQASNMLNLRLRKVEAAGAALDALVAAGVNQINGPVFGLEDADAALDAARRDAVKKVYARAALYAAAAGLKVKRLVHMSEGGGVQQQPLPMAFKTARAMADIAPTPVAPGEIAARIDVQATFELE